MLTVELKVNGSMIEYISIINKGYQPDSDNWLYDICYTKIGHGIERKCSVTHKRDEGALVLVAKAIEEISKC